jgi:hypothetical protein
MSLIPLLLLQPLPKLLTNELDFVPPVQFGQRRVLGALGQQVDQLVSRFGYAQHNGIND